MIFLQSLPTVVTSPSSEQLNLQSVTIWVTKDYFFIELNVRRRSQANQLCINRLTGQIRQILLKPKPQEARPHLFSCLLGIINFSGKKALVVAQNVNLVASLNNRDIFRIVKPIYLFYDPNDKKKLNYMQAEILLNITMIFEQDIYFSYCYDLALPLNSTDFNSLQTKKFNWAHHLQAELESFDDDWRLSFIQGFVAKIQMHINGLNMFIMLVSRRAVKQGLTQLEARGLDNEGNTGNFVETELILQIRQYFFSFVQCRGTVPIFWSEQANNYGLSNVKCLGSKQNNYEEFIKHNQLITKRCSYSNLLLVNLLSSQKEERKLLQNYEGLVRKLLRQDQVKTIGANVHYVYYDVHSHCSNKQYTKLNMLIEKQLAAVIQACGTSTLICNTKLKKKEIICRQKGIMRINCFNCIDRTNIFQSRVTAYKLIQVLKDLNIQVNEFENGLAFLENDTLFSNLYRNLWADNGDALSRQYTGTGSTQSFAMRKGKLSYLTMLDHGIKSLFRAVRNLSNQDEAKNRATRFLLGECLKIEQQNNQNKNQQEPQLTSRELNTSHIANQTIINNGLVCQSTKRTEEINLMDL